MTEELIRVLVVDDHAVVREGIRTVLEGTAGFEVVGEAGDGAEAMVLAERHHPDVVLLDVTMPGQSGLQVASRLRKRLPSTRVLILSMHDRTEYVLEAVRAGASGYLLKDASPRDLRDAVRTVQKGEAYFAPAVAQKLSAALRGELEEEQRRGNLGLLTPREQEVLTLIADGRTNKEIAGELGISPRTVETHRESLMRKLRIHTVAGLTRFAIDAGLIND
ncbi:MAG: response regulator transcription factor [Gemmatimonadota bacterium]|nr:MAG: response regulator transcription factor [Gemmatimonadota bacterium]